MKKRESTARGPSGDHTEIWRAFSWYLGDEHADRLCRLLDWYLRIVGRRPQTFWPALPR